MIKNFLQLIKRNKNKTNSRYQKVPYISQLFAFTVDFLILSMPRLIVLIIGALTAEDARVRLVEGIKNLCGDITGFSFANKEHIELLVNSDYVQSMVVIGAITVSIGALYRLLMWSSSYQATIGERFVRIIVIKQNEGEAITPIDATARALISYAIWFFPPIAVLYWSTQKYISIIFLVLTSIWGDASFIGKKGFTIPDILTQTIQTVGIIKNKKFRFFSNSS